MIFICRNWQYYGSIAEALYVCDALLSVGSLEVLVRIWLQHHVVLIKPAASTRFLLTLNT